MEYSITVEELRKRSLFLATPMYGGQCAGMFTKSVADLSVLCSKYGIELRCFFLFNESLITRARNYCVDEFLRSGYTHLMFIDSDIGFDPNDVISLLALSGEETPYDVIGGPYPKKSAPYDTIIMTEHGPKKLGWIVSNKWSGKVLTINEKTGQFAWNSIVQHHQNRNEGKWMRLRFDNRRRAKSIILTKDHEMISVTDPLRPEISRTMAEAMVGKFSVVTPSRNRNALFNNEQVSVIIGSLLGDAHISKRNGRLSVGHCEDQEEYLNFKKNVLSVGNVREYENKGFGRKGKRVINLDVPVNAQTNTLRDAFYHNNIKSPKGMLSYIDPIALAFWYMDDGCLKKSGNTSYYCELNTQGFSDEDQTALVDFFAENYGFDVRIDNMRSAAKSKTDVIYKRLRFLNGDADKFFDMISSYVPECMEYKLPPKYRGGVKHSYNTELLEYALLPVLEAESIDHDSDQYDIGVENNHNFVSNDIVVSNCISWEKIKLAVDKGVADTDPNTLSDFVGDFVFNPVVNEETQKNGIPLSEPADVLEIGTGFMMVRRQTFENYQKSYPELMYKPDHVRTEHFDGSREIMAFFDCVIDPKTKRYLSEDYMFCQYVRNMGGRVWICPWMKLQHVGMYIFGGSLASMASIGASATADDSANPNNVKKKKEKK